MNTNSKITLAIIVVVLIAGGVYIFSEKANAPTDGQNQVGETSTSTSSVGLSNGSINIETSEGKMNVPVLNAEELAKIPKPNLNRPIVITAKMDDATKAQVQTIIKQTIEEVNKNPTSLDTWVRLGTDFKIIGDYKSAKEIWEYVVKANPSNISALSNLGDLLTHYLKDYASAENYFKQVINTNSTFVTGYLNLFDLYRYYYKIDTTLAADTLKTGIAKNPKAIDLYISIAGYYAQKGDTASAKSYYSQALSLAKEIKNDDLIKSIGDILANFK